MVYFILPLRLASQGKQVECISPHETGNGSSSTHRLQGMPIPNTIHVPVGRRGLSSQYDIYSNVITQCVDGSKTESPQDLSLKSLSLEGGSLTLI